MFDKDMEFYEQYHQKGGNYVIPVEVFEELLSDKGELFEENEELKKQFNELQKPQIFIDTQDMEERYGEELYQDYLEQQVKDLKKQLEDTIEELECVRCDLHNRTSERDSAEKQNDLYKNQQQEFIKNLEEKEKQFDRIGDSINSGACCGILQKYLEIIGVQDENTKN